MIIKLEDTNFNGNIKIFIKQVLRTIPFNVKSVFHENYDRIFR